MEVNTMGMIKELDLGSKQQPKGIRPEPSNWYIICDIGSPGRSLALVSYDERVHRIDPAGGMLTGIELDDALKDYIFLENVTGRVRIIVDPAGGQE